MAASPSRNFIRFAYGADLRLGFTTPKLGTTCSTASCTSRRTWIAGSFPPIPTWPLSRDLRELGGYVALTQELGPHFAAGLRYDFYDPDRDSADPARPLVPTRFTVQTISAVAAAVLGTVRLSAEYDRNTQPQRARRRRQPAEPGQRHGRRAGTGDVLMRAPVHSIRGAALSRCSPAGAGACTDASSDPGVNAMLRLTGTGVQYVPGTLGTDPAADAPTMQDSQVISTDSSSRGRRIGPLSGSALGSSAVLIGARRGHRPLDRADGAARYADVEGAFDFSTRFSVSPLLPLDPPEQTMIIRAVDAAGTGRAAALLSPQGAGARQPARVPLDGQPLVVTLTWDTEADLDLKVRVTERLRSGRAAHRHLDQAPRRPPAARPRRSAVPG